VNDEAETVDKSGERKERPIDRVRNLAEDAGVPWKETRLGATPRSRQGSSARLSERHRRRFVREREESRREGRGT
jgi:hypothetical protein